MDLQDLILQERIRNDLKNTVLHLSVFASIVVEISSCRRKAKFPTYVTAHRDPVDRPNESKTGDKLTDFANGGNQEKCLRR